MPIVSLAIAKSRTSKGKTYNLTYDTIAKTYACACPAWTRNMPRTDCLHILAFKGLLLGGEAPLITKVHPFGENLIKAERAKNAPKSDQPVVVDETLDGASIRFSLLELD